MSAATAPMEPARPRTEQDEHGCVRVVMRDTTGYVFQIEHADALLAAVAAPWWQRWLRPTFTGYGPHGERVTVRLRDVEAVIRWTPAQLASQQAEEREQQRFNALFSDGDS